MAEEDGEVLSKTIKLVKEDWYQTEDYMVISIFAKNFLENTLQVQITETELLCTFTTADGVVTTTTYKLSHLIDPHKSSYKLMSTKIEVKLKKQEPIRWNKLEADPDEIRELKTSLPTITMRQPKNWDKIEKEIEKQESEKVSDDEALTNLFQDIYGKSTDEVKKAMNKSFFESGGTVLSTNWNEVSQKTVDVKPPDGVEFKKWN